MAHLKIYAGSTQSGISELPSPDELKPTHEIIWSENTGRAQSGTNKAKMIGDVVAEKRTWAIRWGMVSGTDMTSIKTKLAPGFFWFGVGTSKAAAETDASKYYRSEISATIVQAGAEIWYKDVNVSVIEQ